MRARRVGLVCLSLVMSGVAAMTSGTTTATALADDGGTDLPFQHFWQILADPAHGHAFVTGGRDEDGVAVFDSRGRLTRLLPDLPGASQMTLSPDGQRVYVALVSGDGIAAINTKTLAVRRIDTGPQSCPESAAETSGLIWVSAVCDESGAYEGGLLTVDPHTWAVRPAVVGNAFHIAQFMVSSPTRPGDLFAYTYEWDTTGPVEIFHVSRNRSAARAVRRVVGAGVQDLAVTPDGLDAVTAVAEDPPAHRVVTTRGAHLADVIPSDVTPVAVAVRRDGLVAAGVGFLNGASGQDDKDVYLRATATAGRTRGITLDKGPGGHLQPRGLAFGRRHLYFVTEGPEGFELRVRAMPRVHLVNISPDSAVHVSGDRVTVAAHVTGTNASKRTVAIYARRLGARHRTLIRRGHPGRYGNVLAHLRTAKTTSFSAVVAGRGSSKRSAVAVSPGLRFRDRISDAADKTTDTRNMPMGSRPRLSTRVKPAHPGQCVSFHLFTSDPWRQGPNDVSSGCRRLDRHGRASWVVPKDMSFGEFKLRVEWRGDRFNQPDTGRWHEIDFPCDRAGATPPDCE